MNEHSDISGALRHWFDEGPSTMPDRVVDVVAERIGRQPQHPAWRLSWRDSHVNTYLKPLLAVAAVVVVAVAGLAIFGRPLGSTVGGSLLPSPTATPAPSAPPVNLAWWLNSTEGRCGGSRTNNGCAGPLAPGTHRSGYFYSAVTYTVPDGWINMRDREDYFELFPDTPANRSALAARRDPVTEIVIRYSRGPMFMANCGVSVDQAMSALAVLDPSSAPSIRRVTINGLSGSQIDLTWEPDWGDQALCPLEGGPTASRPPDTGPLRVILLRAQNGYGTYKIYARTRQADDFDRFMTQAMPVIETFEFTPVK